MSNPASLQIGAAVELSGQMKAAVNEFAQKEQQFSREMRNRRATEARKYRDASTAAETWLNSQSTRTETSINEKVTHTRDVYAARRTRIERAQRMGTDNLVKQAKRTRERWMEKLQMRHFEATRGKPADLKAAETAFGEMAADLAHQRARLLSLKKEARGAFFGYLSFFRFLRARNPIDMLPPDYTSLSEALTVAFQTAEERLAGFREFPIPRILRFFPVFITLPLLIATGAYFTFYAHPEAVSGPLAGGMLGMLCVVLCVLQYVGGVKSKAAAEALGSALGEAERIYDATAVALQTEYDAEHQRITEDYTNKFAEIDEQWAQSDEVESKFIAERRTKSEGQAPRLLRKNEELLNVRLQRIASERATQLAQINREASTHKQNLIATHEADIAQMDTDEATQWNELENAWKNQILPLYERIAAMHAAVEKYAPAWSASFLKNWQPPVTFPPLVKFGALNLDLSALEGQAEPARFALPGPAQISIPLALTFPDQGSLLFETMDSGAASVIDTLNNVILRILSTAPPGKISFTILDPMGLGRNFAGLMHLADFEESLISRRIWTQQDQIEERLAELNEHIEKVIQMYLRNEYATITEYNAQAGSVAEKYHFLVVADFPANFSETAVKRLQSIAVSGPRCGVYTLIHWDRRQPQPDGFVPDELRKNSVCIRHQHEKWILAQKQIPPEATFVFDAPPESGLAVGLVHKIGESSIDANRVEVPFSQIAPSTLWTGDTTNEVRVAVGRTGATKLQYLALGKGTRQHALFAGKTGSGKSTLFHVIITNLALTYSPDQVEFYLIDFKKGVEFKCYAANHLPHARVIAIESDREFGLSVLQRVDEELKRRGDMFRKLGVQDIAGYKREGGTEPIPRSLLIIDEFQEFFVQDDQISQTASLLFDRIVRQGRAFGIHVLLGSQTLGGAYTLARATLGQMVVRVALQCNEADAYLIMDDNNAAPRLLSRPGEGIYNDMAGAPEGNSPFQVVWLPDEEREKRLLQIRQHAEETKSKGMQPIVFEGNAPADIHENTLLSDALNTAAPLAPAIVRSWLGAPNSIKGPTEATFQKQSGSNLLIVGQREEAALTILGASLLALAAQYPAGSAKFYVFHTGSGGNSDVLEKVAISLPHSVTLARQNQEVSDAMATLAAELKARSGGEAAPDAPDLFVFIHGLQKFKKLRHEDDFSFSSDPDAPADAGAQLGSLLSEGGSYGIHILVSVDTFNNVNRFLSRKALSEFEMRVVFQMSANDSSSLIDTPQASALGLHRAIFYNEHNGHLETFRPYALPDPEWIQEAVSRVSAPA